MNPFMILVRESYTRLPPPKAALYGWLETNFVCELSNTLYWGIAARRRSIPCSQEINSLLGSVPSKQNDLSPGP